MRNLTNTELTCSFGGAMANQNPEIPYVVGVAIGMVAGLQFVKNDNMMPVVLCAALGGAIGLYIGKTFYLESSGNFDK